MFAPLARVAAAFAVLDSGDARFSLKNLKTNFISVVEILSNK